LVLLGLWPLGTLGWPEATPELARYFPTSVLVTGHDILFFWVARMMMMQLALVEEVPFDTVYVHALVRDERGKKMSKSLGNVIDPLDLIDEFGADAVRFTMAALAAMGRDLRLSKDRVAGYRNFGTKLWNAHRFAEMNGVEARPEGLPTATAPVNRWIMGETARARVAVDEALEAFRFDEAARALHAFVWGVVCDWYVEFSKPLLQGDDPGRPRRDAGGHGLGARPVPPAHAPLHALHHRGPVGRDRRSRQAPRARRLADLRAGARRP
jgi:valyl-tRNA synthetase